MKRIMLNLIVCLLVGVIYPSEIYSQRSSGTIVVKDLNSAKESKVTDKKNFWNDHKMVLKNSRAVAKEIKIYAVDPMTVHKTEPELVMTKIIPRKSKMTVYCDENYIYLYTLSDDDHKEFFTFDDVYW